jgi:hypothetical protein
MRPLGLNLADFFQGFRGKGIYELPKDLVLPESLIVIHEHSDNFSLQTRQPTQPEKFCLEVEELLKKMRRLTKE